VEHISRKGTGNQLIEGAVPEETGLPDDLRNLFRKAREKKIGFVPNAFKATASVPSACARGSASTSSCTSRRIIWVRQNRG
jgi:hypothetical protein